MNPKAMPYDPAARDARQRAYQSVRTLAEDYPGVDEVCVEMQFFYADGASFAPAHARIFQPGMQAFFEFRCPDAACQGGGFRLGDVMHSALRGDAGMARGTMRCQGKKSGATCLMELHYGVRQTSARRSKPAAPALRLQRRRS